MILYYILHFRIILDLQKSLKDNTDHSLRPPHPFPLLLTPNSTLVPLSQGKKINTGTFVIFFNGGIVALHYCVSFYYTMK